MTIFADSSALISLFNPVDSNNQRAISISKKLTGFHILISNYIFAETVTILSQRVGKPEAVAAGEKIKNDFTYVEIKNDIEELSWQIFKEQTSKNVSYVDCTIFALYRKGIFDKAFSFDQEFKKNKIPLVS